MIKMSMRRFEEELRAARIPEGEISIVVHNLEALYDAGLSMDEISIVVHNLVNKPRFKSAFLDNYRAAVSELFPAFRN